MSPPISGLNGDNKLTKMFPSKPETDGNKLKKLNNKNLHINYKNILTNRTYNVIFTNEKEVIIWKLIIKL
jgi:hypothetical protein